MEVVLEGATQASSTSTHTGRIGLLANSVTLCIEKLSIYIHALNHQRPQFYENVGLI